MSSFYNIFSYYYVVVVVVVVVVGHITGSSGGIYCQYNHIYLLIAFRRSSQGINMG